METADVALCNEVLSATTWLEVIQSIPVEANSAVHEGKFEVPTTKGRLLFQVFISEEFPLGPIFFSCNQVYGYPHVAVSGILCLHAPPAEGVAGRLELELAKLQIWIDKYYIKEEQDERFEYLQFPDDQDPTLVVFEEDSSSIPVNDNQGVFIYHLLNEPLGSGEKFRNFIVSDIGGRDCRWSKTFKASLGKKFTGIWATIPELPTSIRRLRIQYWKDLLKLLTAEQCHFLYDKSRDIRSISGFADRILLMLGYIIPDGTTHQQHWDLISIPSNEFPYKKERISSNEYSYIDLGKKIKWGLTENASYDRMFGRGKLCNDLTDKSILIVGTGAIGSNLLITLTRGGCKNIHLVDSDTVSSGNACRGYFGIDDTGKIKTKHLQQSATAISPYVEITETHSKLTSHIPQYKDYPKLKKYLNKFDYIVDCSTDKYLSIMLDGMQLKGQILNFSISHGANHLVMATGFNNTRVVKNSVYNRISPGDNEPFFEGTGCWHPTFQASYSDLNVLVAIAINEINHRIISGMPINSFIIHKTTTETNKIQYETDYRI